MRDVAQKLKVSVHKVHDMVRDGLIVCSRRNLKPRLSPEHRLARTAWVKKFITEKGDVNDLMDYIHIDEKWFYVHHDGSKIYVTARRTDTRRFQSNTSRISKRL